MGMEHYEGWGWSIYEGWIGVERKVVCCRYRIGSNGLAISYHSR